jgi:glycosyltransferase involved in cell wall biosynthesis
MCLDILKDAAGSRELGARSKTEDKEKSFEVRNIKLNYSKDMSDIGKINLDKVRGIFYVKRQIKKAIKEFKPDIIYFVPATYSFGLIRDWFFVREIKKYWKGQILFHIRSRILDKTWNSKWGRKLLKDMYSGNKAIMLGKELIGDLKGIIPYKDISILPNAIKNEVSESELKKIISKRKKNKQFNILFLSNMDRTKGWPQLLEACKILNGKKFNFRCDFVGAWWNKEDEKFFYDFIEKNKLDKRVFSHGAKSGEDKNKFLKEADVLVFPTTMDTFGKVLIEAYMFGTPVIANREGSIPSIVDDDKTGFLLDKNTGEEIAGKVLESKDWEKMGLLGRAKFLDEFEIEVFRERFLGLFQ